MTLLSLFQVFVLVILLVFFDVYSKVLGGLLHMLVALTFMIPYIGRLFRLVLVDFIKFGIVTKIFSWLVSASGMLLGYLIYYWIWRSPPDRVGFWAMLIVSVAVVINITYDLCLFQVLPYSVFYRDFARFPSFGLFDLLKDNEQVKAASSRSLFVDLHLPQLFRLLTSIGVVYFAMAHLGLVQPTGRTIPDIFDCLKLSFSSIPIVTKPDPIFKGSVWQLCSMISAFLIFFWTVFFLSFAQSMFMDLEKQDSAGQQNNFFFDQLVTVLEQKFPARKTRKKVRKDPPEAAGQNPWEGTP